MPTPSQTLHRIGVATLVFAAVARVLALLSAQSPSSPWRIALFAGPLESLQLSLLFVGFFSILAVRISTSFIEWRTVFCVIVGAKLISIAALVGASTGMLGVQLADPRPWALSLFLVRTLGELFLGLSVFFWIRALSRSGNES